tara:strand:+ start:207 stop:446 length:240 start_codon:yes stop_codon:yes gene_type:complete
MSEEETKIETPKLTPEQQAHARKMAKRMMDTGAYNQKPLKYSKRGVDNSWGVPRGQIYEDFNGRKYVKDAKGVVRRVDK